MAYDIVIKNGLVVDGTGGAPYRADVAIHGERVAAVGKITDRAKRTIDAEGHLVTPGFVDIHTHLDAQISWDPIASSSCWHGVTSVVMGNCGVTFAPCRPQDREYLAHLMESVEDIPAETIMAGMAWTWETYGEYLKALDALPKGVNVGGLVGHCAVRYWAMGEESLENKPASPEAIARMHDVVAEAIAGGALGFSTSRTILHRTPEGQPVPGTFATFEELMGIAKALGELRRGVVEAAPGVDSGQPADIEREVRWMTEVSLATGRPVTFGLAQSRPHPDVYASMLAQISASAARGARIFAQSTTRGIGVLFGFVNRTPFDRAPSWRALRTLRPEEKVAKLRDPEYRATMVREALDDPPPIDFSQIFLLPDGEARYDHRPDESLQAHARRLGVSPAEAFIVLSLEKEGKALFNYPFLNPQFAAVEKMLDHPQVVIGLGDSGAHCGQIMDSSLPTYFLKYWVQERQHFTVAQAIRKLTSEPARLFGIEDRGVIRQGAYADLNVIDYDQLRLPPPTFVYDLPAGGGRYIQKSSGYKYTLVNGQVFMEGLEHTGAFAGRVLRSA
ncbi:MAG TPA: amidohydrolase family protein [Candidatus Binatia bacterium]|nr:amidohydrolase family protein [Candidatus Binatia bacterium]